MNNKTQQLWLNYIKATRLQNVSEQKTIMTELFQTRKQQLILESDMNEIQYFVISRIKPTLDQVDLTFTNEDDKFIIAFLSADNNDTKLSFVFQMTTDGCSFINAYEELADGSVNDVVDEDVTQLGHNLCDAITNQNPSIFSSNEEVLYNYLTKS